MSNWTPQRSKPVCTDQPNLIGRNAKLTLGHEYYLLLDRRTERQVFSSKRWYDDDPERTKTLFMNFRERIKKKYPSWDAGPGIFKWGFPMVENKNPDIFDASSPKGVRLGLDQSIPLSSHELPPVSAYRRPAPIKGLPHFDRLRVGAPTLDNLGAWPLYHFVSAAWKEAIEAVEPGVHEFHPLEVRFADKSFHHFIFRPMHFGDPADFVDSYVSESYLDLRPPNFMIKRDAVAGKHFIWSCSNTSMLPTYMFLSRELAQRLQPLLANNIFLIPAEVA